MKRVFRSRVKQRNSKGAILAETTASTALLYGFVIVLLYFVAQACFGLLIMNGLSQAAREAARELSVLYVRSGGSSTPSSASINEVFEKIAVGGVVNNASQFSATWPTSYVRNSHPQQTVTVICTAAPGQTGTVKNLAFPWTSLSYFTAKFSLAGLNMQASATYPLRP